VPEQIKERTQTETTASGSYAYVVLWGMGRLCCLLSWFSVLGMSSKAGKGYSHLYKPKVVFTVLAPRKLSLLGALGCMHVHGRRRSGSKFKRVNGATVETQPKIVCLSHTRRKQVRNHSHMHSTHAYLQQPHRAMPTCSGLCQT
jgi:hypothetical protein